jgi:hypothetical protein
MSPDVERAETRARRFARRSHRHRDGLGTIYFRSDMVLLQWLRGDAATGAYGAAYRLFEGAFFLPALILAALFPALAERMVTSRADIGPLVRRAVGWMATLGLASAAFLAFAVAPLLQRIYGDDDAESAVLLQLLAPALCLIFPNYVLLHFLVAAGRQKVIAWVAALRRPGLPRAQPRPHSNARRARSRGGDGRHRGGPVHGRVDPRPRGRSRGTRLPRPGWRFRRVAPLAPGSSS